MFRGVQVCNGTGVEKYIEAVLNFRSQLQSLDVEGQRGNGY